MSFAVEEVAIGAARARVVAPVEPNGVGVLLYPTIFGVNAPMDRFAGELAALGMTAVVWDPYRGKPISDELMVMVKRSVGIEDTDAIEDVTAITNHMRSVLALDRLGGLGWCFGGRIGLLHAGLDDRIAAICHLQPDDPLADSDRGGGRRHHQQSRHAGPDDGRIRLGRADRRARPGDPPPSTTSPSRPSTKNWWRPCCGARSRPLYEYYPGVGHGFSYEADEANEIAHAYAWARTASLLGSLAA